jgi:hypothetical protein
LRSAVKKTEDVSSIEKNCRHQNEKLIPDREQKSSTIYGDPGNQKDWMVAPFFNVNGMLVDGLIKPELIFSRGHFKQLVKKKGR